MLFQHEYSANFLFTLWKRVRKYGACCTGLTQNVDDLLQSHTARTMLANSEFLVMLNQAATDRAELARLLNISDNQLSYITKGKCYSLNRNTKSRNFDKALSFHQIRPTNR